MKSFIWFWMSVSHRISVEFGQPWHGCAARFLKKKYIQSMYICIKRPHAAWQLCAETDGDDRMFDYFSHHLLNSHTFRSSSCSSVVIQFMRKELNMTYLVRVIIINITVVLFNVNFVCFNDKTSTLPLIMFIFQSAEKFAFLHYTLAQDTEKIPFLHLTNRCLRFHSSMIFRWDISQIEC